MVGWRWWNGSLGDRPARRHHRQVERETAGPCRDRGRDNGGCGDSGGDGVLLGCHGEHGGLDHLTVGHGSASCRCSWDELLWRHLTYQNVTRVTRTQYQMSHFVAFLGLYVHILKTRHHKTWLRYSRFWSSPDTAACCCSTNWGLP